MRAQDVPTAQGLILIRVPWPGRPFPLGATWDGEGTNFSLFSENAERVELCLFDDADVETRHELTERTAFNWHGYLPDVGPASLHARLPPGLRLQRPDVLEPLRRLLGGPVGEVAGRLPGLAPLASSGAATSRKAKARAVFGSSSIIA